MKTLLLSILVVIAAMGHLNAQNQLVASSKKNSTKKHQLKIPGNMKVDYMGKVEKRVVTAVDEVGLATSAGVVPFDQLTSLRATRKKSTGKKVIGAILFAGGLFYTFIGVASTATDFGDSRAAQISVTLAGAGVAVGGYALMSSRRTYKSEDWDFHVLPSERGTVPVVSDR